ncbi:hypothetical protein BJ165DRAFT_1521938 [Panaeolus papilionaceus]|nr:hypothetical protein BJ165DRAFT_1521938 [Panaeolus papilionaceus]
MSDISLGRYLGDEPLDAEMPGWEKLSKGENAVLEVGDPMIMWTIGDYLAPSHHGQGIMNDAAETLL